MPDYQSKRQKGVSSSDWKKYHNLQNAQLAVKNHTGLCKLFSMPAADAPQVDFTVNRPAYPAQNCEQ